MIIAVVNEKGGSAKTTIAVNLSILLAQNNLEVLLIDSDPQASIQAFNDIRASENKDMLFISVSKLGDTLAREAKSMEGKYDCIVIDTGGRDSKEMRQALVIADILIIPTIPSQYDVSVLDKMIRLYDEARIINPNSKAYIIIARASPNPFLEKKIHDLRFYIEEKRLENLSLMESIIHEREAYKNAVASGLGITEYCNSNDKAYIEFIEFYNELLKDMKENNQD